MSLSDGFWRLGLTARLGLAEFDASNPRWILLSAFIPRAVLQCLFFTVLGHVTGGDALRAYAFCGALASILTLSGTIAVIDVPQIDKVHGTFFRLRTGCLHPFVVFLMRALPYPVLGFVFTVTSMLIVAPLTGLTDLAVRLLPWLPIYLLMACTTTAAGLAGAAMAVGRRSSAFVGNLLAYLILLTGGVFLAPGRLPWVDRIGVVLPVRHGLEAVRAGLAGEPWLSAVAAEAVVGLGWCAVAWAVVAVQVRRAHRHGFDDFS